MPNPKRQLVLYAFIVLGVLLIAGVGWWQMHTYLSFIAGEKERKEAARSVATPPDAGAASFAVEVPFEFEVVGSPAAMERGLGGRTNVPSDYGMLFVFPRSDRYGFWMKDMQVPIDILWLSDNGQVVHLEREVSPDSYPTVLKPSMPARYVLETRAGEAERKGWNVGTKIDLPLPYGK